MLRFAFCLPALFALSACTDFTGYNNYTTSTTHENEAIWPMLYIEESEIGGHEMTPLYKPGLYAQNHQDNNSPPVHQTTLDALAQNSW
jgi:hypothetical protein